MENTVVGSLRRWINVKPRYRALAPDPFRLCKGKAPVDHHSFGICG